MKEKIWVGLQLNAVSILRAKGRLVSAQRESLEEWGLLLSLQAHTTASGCLGFCPNNKIKGVMLHFLFWKMESLAFFFFLRDNCILFLKIGLIIYSIIIKLIRILLFSNSFNEVFHLAGNL